MRAKMTSEASACARREAGRDRGLESREPPGMPAEGKPREETGPAAFMQRMMLRRLFASAKGKSK